ncbi:MAG: helix-turn-helix transcriptional regulator [Pseudomonadota bacterium]
MPQPSIARYRPRALLQRMALGLGMTDLELVLAAGLPRQVAEDPSPSVTAAEYFRIWETIDSLVPGGISVEQVCANARGPFSAQTFAFSCSPDVATGLERLAVFKPLSGPYALSVTRSADLRIDIASTDPSAPIPAQLHGMEIVHLLELIRMCTGHTVKPVNISIPDPGIGAVGYRARREAVGDHAGVEIADGSLSMTLSETDARRPLVSANAEQWAAFEPSLLRQLAAIRRDATMVDQLRAALFEVLPSGRADADAAARKLLTSKRSLQRKLRAEGTSYGAVLKTVRYELALHYLAREDLRVEEVSYLLAFRDPNSFYRAFQSWSGMTPRAARMAAHHEGTGVDPLGPAPLAASRPPHAVTELS